MQGRFLRGVLIGGILGAALTTQWDAIKKKCPFLDEIKEDWLFDQTGRTRRGKAAAPREKTRLMARRHKIN